MMKSISRAAALAAVLTVTACGPSPEKAPEGASATATLPTPVRSKGGIEMVFLPGGTFTMGSNQGNPDEAPAHQVRLSPFLIDTFEVTHAQFAKVQLPDPSHWQEDPAQPVERVRWRDAKQYCNERSLAEGLKPCYDEKSADWTCDYTANGYRLPTEAEWEYACRAGGEEPYDFGQVDKLRLHSWYAATADQKTHPVGLKRPNRWGVHDLYGNVSEWCEDVYSASYYRESPVLDPAGPPSPGKDVKRVIRGGSWKSSPEMCRASFRQAEKTGDTDACFFTDFCGFRCVRRPGAEELKGLLSGSR
ncbi:MAG TPA: hypothetical protein DCM86_06820 [Verrucomicrobiales bacterium]|nr:hypothetical protein [Verrucomicrobiales bacterium]